MNSKHFVGILLALGFATHALAGDDHTDYRAFAREVKDELAKTPEQQRDQNTLSVIEFDEAKKYVVVGINKFELKEALQIPQDSDLLENKYFKIVAYEVTGQKFDPVTKRVIDRGVLNESPASIYDFDARNVLFHLMKARLYYGDIDQAAFPEAQNAIEHEQITVRIRVTNIYSEDNHFGLNPMLNVSMTQKADVKGRWGREIHFHAYKVEKKRKSKLELVISGAMIGVGFIFGDWKSLTGIPYLFIHDKISGLDTAKMPSAIYHEYFHIVADNPRLLEHWGYSQPISEDFANYFGSVIENSARMFGIRSFGDKKSIRHFQKIEEVKKPKRDLNYNYKNLLPQIFWNIRYRIGDSTDAKIWRSLPRLNKDSFPTDVADAVTTQFDQDEESQYVRTLFGQQSCSLAHLDGTFDWYYVSKRNLPSRNTDQYYKPFCDPPKTTP